MKANQIVIENKWYHFLAPRHWPMWLALGVLRFCSSLPYPFILKLGKGLGYLAKIILKKKRHIAEVNLRLCFPQLSEKEHKELLKKNFASIGIGVFEVGLAWWASDKRLKKLSITSGLENIEIAKKQKYGVLIATHHSTMIELGLRLISLYIPVSVMFRAQKNELFNWIMQRARARYVTGIIREDVKLMFRQLQVGKVVIYTPDQDYGRKNSVFVPFFGISAASVTGTSRFVKKMQIPTLFAKYYRDKNNNKYVIRILPQLENFPSNDKEKDARRINALVEHVILQHPEQYLWQHRRFKTRPEGEKYPY